mmetsp:Transcript_94947/g.247791  ORF Transcript_94947/g.247791 Transcript_94947/m.247791 type:complete len:93 (+) Transcript_94947:162-440(+)
MRSAVLDVSRFDLHTCAPGMNATLVSSLVFLARCLGPPLAMSRHVPMQRSRVAPCSVWLCDFVVWGTTVAGGADGMPYCRGTARGRVMLSAT